MLHTSLTHKEADGYTIANVAASRVAKVLGHDSEVCNIHIGDKLAPSAHRVLLHTKDKESVNLFPEGNTLIAPIYITIAHFSTTQGYGNLIQLCKPTG